MKVSKSKNHNPNYLAKIVKIKDWHQHPNADKLKIAIIDYQPVLISKDAEKGIYVYFPVESQISKYFLSETNSFRKTELNKDNTKSGFFEEKGRVKAIKLRGEYSMGYIVPIQTLIDVYGNFDYEIGQEFDMIGSNLLVQKYEIPQPKRKGIGSRKQPKTLSRLIDNQVFLHKDTLNLRRNLYKINPNDLISITYKLHGTSASYQNVLTKERQPKWKRILGLKPKTKYDIVYTSRKVIKNKYFDDPKNKNPYYKEDIWGIVAEEIKEKIPKGYSIYGEIVGYIPSGTAIQPKYHYGNKIGEHSFYVYRITRVNRDGYVTELSMPQIQEFCERYDLKSVPLFYHGKAKDLFKTKVKTIEKWRDKFLLKLEELFTEKDCYINKDVPEEGVVIRVESLFNYEVYKLKSFRFLKFETEMLNKNIGEYENSI